MTYQEVMEMTRDMDEGRDRPDIARFSTDERRARDKQIKESSREALERIINPLSKISGGLKIVRGAKGAKGAKKLLGKPGGRKPTVSRSERKTKDGFKSVGAEEFHDLLGKVESLDVEKKSLPSLKNILKSGGKLFRGVGEYEDAIYGISPGNTENELFGVNVPKKLRGSGAGTEIMQDSKRKNLEIPGNKPLVGYAIKQTPEEGSYLDRFYTTGGRGRRTQTYKYDPALADPERIKAGYEPSDVGRYQHSGIYSKDEEKMPENWDEVGGGLSPLVPFGEGNIPGGLEGKFTFDDLVYMKANPFSLSNLTQLQNDQLYRKHADTMTRDLTDPYERYNTLVFGQLTGNSDLENSQLMLSRMRARSPEDIQRLARYIPEGRAWRDLSREERAEVSNRIIGDYNMQGRDRGGLGIAGSFDFSGVADLARQHLANKDFHSQGEGEGDREYIERLSNLIPGISQKTGSLSQLMLKPKTSEYGAMDLHMNRYFDLDPKLVGKTRQVAPSKAHPTHQTRENVPQYLKNIPFESLKSPKVQMMSDEYLRGNTKLRAEAEGKPYGPGMRQWQIWDGIRGHFDPHEQLYPGIHKTTERMPDHRIQEARERLSKSGHWSKTDPDNPHQFKPRNIEPAKDAMYYGLLPINKVINLFKPRPPVQESQQMPRGVDPYMWKSYGGRS
jgi:hypothetical protein